MGVPDDFPIHRHCFGGDLKDARAWLSKYSECKLGFTGLVTYSNVSKVHEVVKNIRMDQFVLETDAPYFLPANAKWNPSKTSFPGQVIFVAQEIAKLKNVSVGEVLFRNIQNSRIIYKRFFEQNNI